MIFCKALLIFLKSKFGLLLSKDKSLLTAQITSITLYQILGWILKRKFPLISPFPAAFIHFIPGGSLPIPE